MLVAVDAAGTIHAVPPADIATAESHIRSGISAHFLDVSVGESAIVRGIIKSKEIEAFKATISGEISATTAVFKSANADGILVSDTATVHKLQLGDAVDEKAEDWVSYLAVVDKVLYRLFRYCMSTFLTNFFMLWNCCA
jgi:hypothetical protein